MIEQPFGKEPGRLTKIRVKDQTPLKSERSVSNNVEYRLNVQFRARYFWDSKVGRRM